MCNDRRAPFGAACAAALALCLPWLWSAPATAQVSNVIGGLGAGAASRAKCANAESQKALKAVRIDDFAALERQIKEQSGEEVEITGGVECGASGSFELVLPPERVQDVVIVHELSHLDFNNSIQQTLGAASCAATEGIADNA